MSNKGVCRTAPATPGLLNSLHMADYTNIHQYMPPTRFASQSSGKLKFLPLHKKPIELIQSTALEQDWNLW